MQNFSPQLFCFPYLRKNRGLYSPKNVGAPTFSLSVLAIPTLGPLVFQLLAHSLIFRITPIPRPSHSLRTLPQKTGGTPPSPATFVTFPGNAILPNGDAVRLPSVHRSLAALRNSFPYVSYAKTGG